MLNEYRNVDGVNSGKYDSVSDALNDCTKWLYARFKRDAKPATIYFNRAGLSSRIISSITQSSDEIVSELFNASLFNMSIVSIWHYQDTISIYCEKREGETNIDIPVMETILSWFN